MYSHSKISISSRTDNSSTTTTPTSNTSTGCICITFEMQKREEKDNTVTQMASGDILLCPVRARATIVHRIRSYAGSSNNTPIFSHLEIRSHWWHHLKADLKCAVAIGEHILHITKHEIGTHSIRLGAAMSMFLGGCPVFLIMMIGRWSSDSFLHYIHTQIIEFNHSSPCLTAGSRTVMGSSHLNNISKQRWNV